MADSWEDRYMKLRDDHSALKLAYNAKVEEVKQTHVQLTKIENLLKIKDKMDAQGAKLISLVLAGRMRGVARYIYLT